MNLKETIKYVRDAVRENQLDGLLDVVSQNMILDCATRIYISNKISQDKKENIKSFNSRTESAKSNLVQGKNSQKVTSFTSSSSEPTQKQLEQLKKHKKCLEEQGIEISKIKDKKSAWNILNKLFTGEI